MRVIGNSEKGRIWRDLSLISSGSEQHCIHPCPLSVVTLDKTPKSIAADQAPPNCSRKINVGHEIEIGRWSKASNQPKSSFSDQVPLAPEQLSSKMVPTFVLWALRSSTIWQSLTKIIQKLPNFSTVSGFALGQMSLAHQLAPRPSYARSVPYNPTMTVAQDGITHRLYIWQAE